MWHRARLMGTKGKIPSWLTWWGWADWPRGHVLVLSLCSNVLSFSHLPSPWYFVMHLLPIFMFLYHSLLLLHCTHTVLYFWISVSCSSLFLFSCLQVLFHVLCIFFCFSIYYPYALMLLELCFLFLFSLHFSFSLQFLFCSLSVSFLDSFIIHSCSLFFSLHMLWFGDW